MTTTDPRQSQDHRTNVARQSHDGHATVARPSHERRALERAGEEQSRAEQSRYLDDNALSHVPRPQPATDGVRETFPRWIHRLLDRIVTEWPQWRWETTLPDGTRDTTAKRELATALLPFGEHTANQAVTELIRTHTGQGRFPPATSAFVAAATRTATEARRARQERAARALRAENNRTIAPPWHSHLYAAVVRRSAGINPNTNAPPGPFLQIVEKYDIRPGDTAPAEALREAEAAWINAGQPAPINPVALTTTRQIDNPPHTDEVA